MKTFRFAVENDDTRRNPDPYHKIHKAGCRDLVDPETFECEPTIAGIFEACDGGPPYFTDYYQTPEEAADYIRSQLMACCARSVKALTRGRQLLNQPLGHAL